MNWFELGLPGLFLICFLAATILPLSSEIVVGLFIGAGYNLWIVFLTATAGNCLGGLTNIFLGRFGRKKATKFSERLFGKEIIEKYGSWLALLSWIPLIGDPLLILLGFYRTTLLLTIVCMIAGKAIRYALLIWFLS